ncbi:MAG: hypothetical protein JWQ50_3678 [Caballeronia mineralivorans]|jgi:hypothetical protein|nr:hypothetical protein [Caballeronia mineralivorans]MEA3103412.1 hypothetical protein [Caballeronia mineralivorans]
MFHVFARSTSTNVTVPSGWNDLRAVTSITESGTDYLYWGL